jgi:hypothetical protein
MFKFLKSTKITALILIVLMLFIIPLAIFSTPKIYKVITNLQLKGWVFGASTWRGQKAWDNDGASLDTLVLAGLDRDCYVYVTADSVSPKAPLFVFDIAADGDSAFIKCDSTVSSDLNYNWMVIR